MNLYPNLAVRSLGQTKLRYHWHAPFSTGLLVANRLDHAPHLRSADKEGSGAFGKAGMIRKWFGVSPVQSIHNKKNKLVFLITTFIYIDVQYITLLANHSKTAWHTYKKKETKNKQAEKRILLRIFA